MNMLIEFGEKKVEFSTCYAWALKYDSQFHRDAMKDIKPAFAGEELDFTTTARIAWASAALCDSKIEPDLIKWVESLGDDFTWEFINQEVVSNILQDSINSKKLNPPTQEEKEEKKEKKNKKQPQD